MPNSSNHISWPSKDLPIVKGLLNVTFEETQLWPDIIKAYVGGYCLLAGRVDGYNDFRFEDPMAYVICVDMFLATLCDDERIVTDLPNEIGEVGRSEGRSFFDLVSDYRNAVKSGVVKHPSQVSRGSSIRSNKRLI